MFEGGRCCEIENKAVENSKCRVPVVFTELEPMGAFGKRAALLPHARQRSTSGTTPVRLWFLWSPSYLLSLVTQLLFQGCTYYLRITSRLAIFVLRLFRLVGLVILDATLTQLFAHDCCFLNSFDCLHKEIPFRFKSSTNTIVTYIRYLCSCVFDSPTDAPRRFKRK